MLLETEMTISERLRRDPQKGKKEFSAHQGFTVIELMIAVAVLAIITSLALPSYRAIMEKRQVTSGAERLSAFLGSVQLESIKRYENVTVSYERGSDSWCIGIVSGTEACECTDTNIDTASCKIDDAVRIIDQDNVNYSGTVDGVSGDGAFVFDPTRGVIFDDSSLSDFDAGASWDLLSENGSYALRVRINPIGRVSLCSPDADAQVPGYDLCPADES